MPQKYHCNDLLYFCAIYLVQKQCNTVLLLKLLLLTPFYDHHAGHSCGGFC